MSRRHVLSVVGVGVLSLYAATGSPHAQNQQPPVVAIPKPGVPEVLTIEGNFVRGAYNNEGYVILGYQVANRSLGEEWMLLEVGMTIRDNVPDYEMKREALSLETPDGKTLPLPSVKEYRAAGTATQALQNRARAQRDSINYFPPRAARPCALTFFTDATSGVVPLDQMDLSPDRACLGRLYFNVPGGIQYGQHWLNVKFEKSLIRVPFRIFTKEEEKLVSKNFKSIKNQVKEAFQPKKKS
jgi:hypothetical protein